MVQPYARLTRGHRHIAVLCTQPFQQRPHAIVQTDLQFGGKVILTIARHKRLHFAVGQGAADQAVGRFGKAQTDQLLRLLLGVFAQTQLARRATQAL